MAKFSPGQILRSSKDNEYKIIRYLGEGVTAQVYLAERTLVTDGVEQFPQGSRVAIKMLQDNLPEDIVQSFRDEPNTIGELLRGFGQNEPVLVPRVVERVIGSDLPQQFLAMEFVTGRPLNELIEEDGPLSEKDALLIAAQMLAVLNVLHTKVRRSYIDFQLQNIWWQAESRQIKVMDWNHVSPQASEGHRPDGVLDDLTRFGAYLYQMVTGKGALQSGETAHALTRRVEAQQREKISIGLWHIIYRALHPNPEHRYQMAAEFRKKVIELQVWQAMPIEELDVDVLTLMRPLQRSLSKGEAVTEDEINEADVLVDILERQRPGDRQVAEYRRQLETLGTDISAAWASGKQYYLAGDFGRTLDKWRPEAESIGRLDLWRWVLAAQAGADVLAQYDINEGRAVFDDELREPLETAIEYMNHKEPLWKKAEETLNRIRLKLTSESLSYLHHEVKAHLIWQEAEAAERVEEWNRAALLYRQIPKLIAPIPYVDLLSEECGWQAEQLNQLVKKCENYADQSSADNNLIQRLKTIESFETLRIQLNNRFINDWKNPVLRIFCEEEAKTRPAEEAEQLLVSALTYGNLGEHRERLDQLLKLTRERKQEEKEKALIEQLRTALKQDFTQGVATLSQMLRKNTMNFLVLIFFVKREVEQRSAEEGIELLTTFLDAGYLGEKKQELSRLLDEKRQVLLLQEARSQASAALVNGDIYALHQAVEQLGKQTPPDLIETIEAKYHEAVAQKSLPLARHLADILNFSIGTSGDTERRRELSELEQELKASDTEFRKTLVNLVEQDVNAGKFDDAKRKIELAKLSIERGAVEELQKFHPLIVVDQCHTSITTLLNEPLFDYGEARKLYARADSELRRIESSDAVSSDRLRERQRQLRNEILLHQANDFFEVAKDESEQKEPDYDQAYRYLQGAERFYRAGEYSDKLKAVGKLKNALRDKQGKAGASGGFDNGFVGLSEAIQQLGNRVRKQLFAVVLLLTVVGAGIAGGMLLVNSQSEQPDVSGQLVAIQESLQSLGTAIANSDIRMNEAAIDAQANNQRTETELAGIQAALATLSAPTPIVITPTETPEPTETPIPVPLSPLDLNFELISPSILDEESAFYDLPNMALVAPEGWQFNLSGEQLQIIDETDNSWQMTLVYTETTSAVQVVQPVINTLEITPAVSANITITWSVLTQTHPLLPGSYQAQWQVSQNDSTRFSEQFTFTVQQPLTVTIPTGDSYRSDPVWNRAANVIQDGVLQETVVEVMGKRIVSQEGIAAFGDTARADAVFLLIRLPGTRQLYWLADQNAQEFNRVDWANLLNMIPDV
ncbi:MAG: hypothetical protein H6652_00470 [Ardenticatenaceae bacterium]|nr:hypothetical protein [Ardenticatenaceae bacterium]